MSTRKIKDAKDLESNELIYFKGHAKATYMSDGRNVEDAINSIDGSGDIVIEELLSTEPTSKFPQVLYVEQSLTDVEKEQARKNIGADDNIEMLSNGNIKLTINGVSKDFMPATPSGDPMHYMYVTAGAEYNDTGADIERTGVYGDTIVWKAGYWWLNELGDITNEEMRNIYEYGYFKMSNNHLASHWQGNTVVRTGLSLSKPDMSAHSEGYAYQGSSIETITHKNLSPGYNIFINHGNSYARSAEKLVKILQCIDFQYLNSASNLDSPFLMCKKLREVRIQNLKYSISFADSKDLSKESVLSMIEHEAATETITVTLHADAYARLATDPDIIAALEDHPLVSLASA